MIVADHDSALWVCTQADHARLSAVLLALWRENGLPDHRQREELLFAVREHDNGWQEADAAPRISGLSGRPIDFKDVDPSERLEIWRRGVQRFAADRPYPVLLIARHAREVNRDYFKNLNWPEFLEELDTLTEELLERAALTVDQLEADYSWLSLADTLSLGACGGLGSSGTVVGERNSYRFALEPGRIRLAPIPFAGATTVEVACRELPNRRFGDAKDLASELLRAVWQRQPVRIEPLEEA